MQLYAKDRQCKYITNISSDKAININFNISANVISINQLTKKCCKEKPVLKYLTKKGGQTRCDILRGLYKYKTDIYKPIYDTF